MKRVYVLILLSLVGFCCKKDLVGSGIVITETRPVENFSAVASNGDFSVTINKSPNYFLSVNGEDNVLAKVKTYVSNGKLIIAYDGIQTHDHKKVSVLINTPILNGIQLNGSGDILAADTWIAPAFNVELGGSGNISASVQPEILHAVVTGSGKLNLSGSSTDADLIVSGSGAMHGFALTSKDVKTGISGSGKIEITATSKLNASISGSGKVYYKGSPLITSHTSGSGGVINAN